MTTSLPEKPKVLSADGREIKIGDRVVDEDGVSGVVLGLVGHKLMKFPYMRPDCGRTDGRGPGGTWEFVGERVRHLDALAQHQGEEDGAILCHVCGRNEWRMEGLRNTCGWCGHVEKTPGGSTANKSTRQEGQAPPVSPGASLATFTKAVNEHLLPRLPKGWKAITDNDRGDFACWVLDEKGKQVSYLHRDPKRAMFSDDEAGELCEVIGADVFRASARHQPEPVRTEVPWVERYLKGKQQ